MLPLTRRLPTLTRTLPTGTLKPTLSTPLRTFTTTPHRLGGSNDPDISESATRFATTLLEDADSGFGFVRSNPRDPKPRSRGVTEIRGPYYSVMGRRYLRDVLETMGPSVDGLKFAGGSFSLLPRPALQSMIDLAHEHGVYVSTGGWIEYILQHPDPQTTIHRYLQTCKNLGFDVIELSSGFLSLPSDDWLRLADTVHSYGLKAKPELGIQFGAGGDTAAQELEKMGTSDPTGLVKLARRFIEEAGVERIMIESEGITENVRSWKTEVVNTIMRELPMEKVMFEAAEPKVFQWYVREFGVDVNLFVDHSQIVQLAALRAGIWGTSDVFGRITSYRP
ncbi:putative sulfonate biosynthesis enzyme [Ascodesmis nigricans]|uniref:Putative sulfonate biosynthesis enzyme n=1 Tax=Ascodesmis nigricans TaxID=341454 RepID=A0A4S2MVB1_9PEZI|nr:putative sulfonate biosynthesis enzyme [Ascodesmis nigricans]